MLNSFLRAKPSDQALQVEIRVLNKENVLLVVNHNQLGQLLCEQATAASS